MQNYKNEIVGELVKDPETIEIKLSAWEQLVRENERYRAIKEFVEKGDYVSLDNVKVLLGVK